MKTHVNDNSVDKSSDKSHNKKTYKRIINNEKRKNERTIYNAIENDDIKVRFKLRRNLTHAASASKDFFGGAEIYFGLHSRRLHMISAINFIKQIDNDEINLKFLEYSIKEAINGVIMWEKSHIITIPLTAVMIKNIRTSSIIANAIHNSGIKKDCFEFSVDESDIINVGTDAMNGISRLHNEGIRLILNGFGRNYGSINMLLSGWFSGVKIDHADFFKKIDDTHEFAPFMIHFLNKIAEYNSIFRIVDGVENECQINTLRTGHIDAVQGSWISPLLTSAQINSVFRS